MKNREDEKQIKRMEDEMLVSDLIMQKEEHATALKTIKFLGEERKVLPRLQEDIKHLEETIESMLTYYRDYNTRIHQSVNQRKNNIKSEFPETHKTRITSLTGDDLREIVEVTTNT